MLVCPDAAVGGGRIEGIEGGDRAECQPGGLPDGGSVPPRSLGGLSPPPPTPTHFLLLCVRLIGANGRKNRNK